MKQPIILPNKSYTFSNYFELNNDIEDILAYFGYRFQAKNWVARLAKVELFQRFTKSLYNS